MNSICTWAGSAALPTQAISYFLFRFRDTKLFSLLWD
jgi:hypothetical protein